MAHRKGRSTWIMDNDPSILEWASVAGKKEGEGPLKDHFDFIYDDTTLGQDTWEQSESMLQKEAMKKMLEKARLDSKDINVLFGGDLLNQCIGSHYGARDFGIPFYGLYGACSTMAEALSLASVFVDTGMADKAAAVTSSHFASAERQFRFPLEYGGQRTPSSQWTATGSGAVCIAKDGGAPYVRAMSAGVIVDMGIKDINNMGAAMAPAAAETIKTFFQDTATSPEDYDMIITGDLGQIGSKLLADLLRKENICIDGKHNDCGLLLYDLESQDVHAGGSGAGCSASVLCSYLLKKVRTGSLQNLLFIATGALMSTVSFQQGESIPAIAHLVHFSSQKGS